MGRDNLPLGDAWGQEFALRGGTKLTITVVGAAASVQLDGAQPPAPAQWAQRPYTLQPGVWSLAVGFGRLRMRNATPGQAATVTWTAWADPTSRAPGVVA